MPAPVSFSLSLAPLPVNFNGTPQQFGDAFVNRLTITPSAPWSSFQNGGALATSDVGPILYNGNEWRVWNPLTGQYTYLTVNGSGIVPNSIAISKISTDVTKANSIFAFDASGAPTTLTTSTVGQVLTRTAGGVGFTDLPAAPHLPTNTFFHVRLSTSQVYGVTNPGTPVTVAFDTVYGTSSDVSFNTTAHQVTLPANTVWYLFARLQIADTGSTPAMSDVSHFLGIDCVGTTNGSFGGETHYKGLGLTFSGVDASGIAVVGSSGGYASCSINSEAAVPTANAFSINYDANTLFGGFRLL